MLQYLEHQNGVKIAVDYFSCTFPLKLQEDELELIVIEGLVKFIGEFLNDQIKQLKNELKEIKIKIDKFTDLLIEDRNIKLIMDKIDSLKLEEERISKLIYDLQSSDVSISTEDVIKKLQQIRDYDYMQPNNIQLFIDSFVEAIYVDKNKKIVVVLSLDYNYYSTEHSWCSDKSLMVELKGTEPGISLLINKHSVNLLCYNQIISKKA